MSYFEPSSPFKNNFLSNGGYRSSFLTQSEPIPQPNPLETFTPSFPPRSSNRLDFFQRRSPDEGADFGVLASFSSAESGREATLPPYEFSASDPIYNSTHKKPDERADNPIIASVINNIISPIHESYKAQEFRLFQKQQLLNEKSAHAERAQGFTLPSSYEIDSARAVTPPITPPDSPIKSRNYSKYPSGNGEEGEGNDRRPRKITPKSLVHTPLFGIGKPTAGASSLGEPVDFQSASSIWSAMPQEQTEDEQGKEKIFPFSISPPLLGRDGNSFGSTPFSSSALNPSSVPTGSHSLHAKQYVETALNGSLELRSEALQVQKLIKGTHVSPYKFLPRSPASKSSSPDADAGSERDSSSSPEESLVPYGGAHGYQPYPPSGQDESESAGSAYYASDEQYLSSIDYETDEYDPHRNRLEDYYGVPFEMDVPSSVLNDAASYVLPWAPPTGMQAQQVQMQMQQRPQHGAQYMQQQPHNQYQQRGANQGMQNQYNQQVPYHVQKQHAGQQVHPQLNQHANAYLQARNQAGKATAMHAQQHQLNQGNPQPNYQAMGQQPQYQHQGMAQRAYQQGYTGPMQKQQQKMHAQQLQQQVQQQQAPPMQFVPPSPAHQQYMKQVMLQQKVVDMENQQQRVYQQQLHEMGRQLFHQQPPQHADRQQHYSAEERKSQQASREVYKQYLENHQHLQTLMNKGQLPMTPILLRRTQSHTRSGSGGNGSGSAPTGDEMNFRKNDSDSSSSDAGMATEDPASERQRQDKQNFLKDFSLIPPSSPEIQNPLQRALITQLQLSPMSKYLYKEFSKSFKDKEKEGFAQALEWTTANIGYIPEKVHWKIYLQLADLAKRENHRKQAKYYYQLVNVVQPYAAKGWIEFAKMKEENGDLRACTNILGQGLFFCPHNESLLVKGIKHSEKMGDINCARALLAKLKSIDIERSWRTIMEGALLEARQGNIEVAKQVFKYLMAQVPSYGPIYTEAAKLEIKMEQYEKGRILVMRGLHYTPTYGPLIFLLLKLEDLMDGDYRACVRDALPKLSKELVWKIWFELAQIEHRRGLIEESNAAYVQSARVCPPSSLWKVWLGGARTEILNKRFFVAEKLLIKALHDVQQKLRSTVLVEFSRFYEYLGRVDDARKILVSAQEEYSLDWKVYLELVLLEIRANDLHKAMKEVKISLENHHSTGRLWAILIQLTHLFHIGSSDVDVQKAVFVQALSTVPKSGEVWCEGARIALHQHLLHHARKYLEFAIQFTPQYGDSFIELMRLELLNVIDLILSSGSDISVEFALEDPQIREPFDLIERLCINAEPTYGVCWSYCKSERNDILKNYLKNALNILLEMATIALDIHRGAPEYASMPDSRKLVYTNLDITAHFLIGNQSIYSRGDSFKFKAIFG